MREFFGDWTKVIDEQLLKDTLSKVLSDCKLSELCPSSENVFKAFTLFPLKDLKAVFIGQDPYPQRGVATGVLFGNNKEIPNDRLSPSLNIIKESVINFEIPHNFITFDNTMEEWGKQGILMINSALTCKVGEVGSHTYIWRPFISSLLKNLSKYNTAIVYVLFGNQAKSFKNSINKNTNYIFEERHPAWYARNKEKMPKEIFDCINYVILGLYGEEFTWYKEENT
jgi:uracil-DNA glycosylase